MSFSKSIPKNPSFFFIKTLKSVFFLFITLNNYYCYYSYFLKSLCNIHQEQLLLIFFFFFFFSLFQHNLKSLTSSLRMTHNSQGLKYLDISSIYPWIPIQNSRRYIREPIFLDILSIFRFFFLFQLIFLDILLIFH